MIVENQELKWQAALIQSARIQDCLPRVLVAKRRHLTLMELTQEQQHGEGVQSQMTGSNRQVRI